MDFAGGGREEPPVALLEVADASAGDQLARSRGSVLSCLPAPLPGAQHRSRELADKRLTFIEIPCACFETAFCTSPLVSRQTGDPTLSNFWTLITVI